MFASAIIERNLPLSFADHLSQLFIKMLPDSAIAKNYASAQTQTCGVIQVLADDAADKTTKAVKDIPFSIATDGNIDKGSEQIYPFILTYYNREKVDTNFLTITTTDSSLTGEAIFNSLNAELSIQVVAFPGTTVSAWAVTMPSSCWGV